MSLVNRLAAPLLLLAIAAAHLYRSPQSAADLDIVPDSEEYATAAERFVTFGRFDIEIEGKRYPPRYAPWFSVGVLAPVYAILGHDRGNGIWAILVFGVAAVLAVYAIGRRLSGEWGGVAAALVLLRFEPFVRYSRLIMTDVPAAALSLLACWLYLRERSAPTRRGLLYAGLSIGAAHALRSVCIVLLVPFLLRARTWRGWRPREFVVLVGPTLAVLAATALYNLGTFGNPLRTGYNFWRPVPCDYPELTFSPAYIATNLRPLMRVPTVFILAGGFAGVILLGLRRVPNLLPLREWIVLTLPISLFHLLYFYPGTRFHFATLLLLCATAGAGAAILIPKRVARVSVAPSLVIAIFALIARPFPVPPPLRTGIAEALATETPRDAVIVSALDAVYLEPIVLRGSGRRLVPLSRDVEYAKRLVAWRRIVNPQPPPMDANDSRSPGLRRGGATDVCSFAADEAPERLVEWARAGRPVFLDLSFAPTDFRPGHLFGDEVKLAQHERYSWLIRLTPTGPP